MPHPLMKRKYWIFDMDGTLTLAQHDFIAMRQALGLPGHQTILESLAELPEAEAAPKRIQLNKIELEIASQAQAAEGATDLLDYLRHQNAQIGILTRNSLQNIEVTLRAAGLWDYFSVENLVSRDCVPPKPHPAGIERLLTQWQGLPTDAVMVGDYLYDLQAGRAAQTSTIYIDPSKKFNHREYADVCIAELHELLS
ncbi:HAD family hydrolase [Thiofilum flexile]|uniref:HAD family hydrolase n=1 Tax=Thiofilum flexile TaxID=125627 RepID=UPI00035E4775|nr:HAD family hydrolase [Thiofilum flexile]